MFDKLKDLGGLMQQAQAMQQKVQELQAELERLEIVGSSGAGLVKVTVSGKNETRRVEIVSMVYGMASIGSCVATCAISFLHSRTASGPAVLICSIVSVTAASSAAVSSTTR